MSLSLSPAPNFDPQINPMAERLKEKITFISQDFYLPSFSFLLLQQQNWKNFTSSVALFHCRISYLKIQIACIYCVLLNFQ
jgi:hypothetical protein